MTNKKRAYRDAQRDYMIEKALSRRIAWKLFWAITLLGLGWRFFGTEANEKTGDIFS